jgi:membrane-bound lytic murein transglycosylase A
MIQGRGAPSSRSPLRRPANITHQTMKTSRPSAAKASSNSNSISILRRVRGGRAIMAAAILGAAVGCSTPPAPTPPSAAPPPAAAATVPPPSTGSRWVAVGFEQLPGWSADRSAEVWPALLKSCERPPPAWITLCAEARLTAPADDASTRQWLAQRLQPYRVESADGNGEGLLTGYFEPLVEASRTRRAAFQTALYAPPADLATRKPYWTRQQLDTLPAAQAALRGREIAYVADPLDALVLQIQGSGRLRIQGSDGRGQTVRLAYAGHNDQPYASVGRWLINQGELKADGANWPAIKDWAKRNPKRVQEMLWANPRVVFFREEPLPDPSVGPRGAMGVPLTPGRSIAVDPRSVPYGTLVWLDSTEPLSSTALQRLVLAQDTGSAITGAVRADYFWGWADGAEAQAGRMKQPLRLWVLWPKAAAPPR